MTRAGVQLAFAAIVALGGAWLVGWWLVGVVLIVIAILAAVDAILRDDGTTELADAKQQLSNEVLERWRRAR